ncbi:hypothetical protein [Candidatus Poriferisodalis sp.]|uniref:hypothetical protein n=1 Tax=Candidatus Poriferisodalis sp. TaxID=3101277 RepID=UPI003B592DD8
MASTGSPDEYDQLTPEFAPEFLDFLLPWMTVHLQPPMEFAIGWSSNLKQIIGFAHLPAHLDPHDVVFLRWDESEHLIDVPISLSRLPFVKPSRK